MDQQSTSLNIIKNQDGTPKTWSELSHEEQQSYGTEDVYSKALARFKSQGTDESNIGGGSQEQGSSVRG